MKYILFSIMIIVCSCHSIIENPTDKFIPGTYIRSSQHEFGTEQDTLILSLQNANHYKIERSWKYERVLDGNKLDPEYNNTTTSAVYDENEHLLKETNTGLEYSFDIKRDILFAGTTEYKKIN